MGVIPPPVRETTAKKPQCRCVILNSNGTKGDRCSSYCTDPDSPLCDGCERNHRGLIEEGIQYAMGPMDPR